jgi:hypothetical protein
MATDNVALKRPLTRLKQLQMDRCAVARKQGFLAVFQQDVKDQSPFFIFSGLHADG